MKIIKKVWISIPFCFQTIRSFNENAFFFFNKPSDIRWKLFTNGSIINNATLLFSCSFLLPDESGQVLQKSNKSFGYAQEEPDKGLHPLCRRVP
jgi:hypothetical protein